MNTPAILDNPELDVLEAQSIVQQQMAQYGNLVPVCSYHFMPIREKRRYKTRMDGTYDTTYILSPIRDLGGRPSILIARDGYQRVFVGTDHFSRKQNWTDKAEPAINIAKDIVRAATGQEPTGPDHPGPAVWIVQSAAYPKSKQEWLLWGTAEFERKFPEFSAECKAWRQRAYLWAEAKVREADYYASQRQHINITNFHRNAAAQVGANETEHSWITFTKQGKTVACPICGKPTSSEHPKCGSCGEIIDYALYEQRIAALKGAVAKPEEPQVPPPATSKQPMPPPMQPPPAAQAKT